MISNKLKKTIKQPVDLWHTTLADGIEKEKLRKSMHFTEASDLEFDLIDFFYSGVLSMIIEDARERCERFNIDRAYGRAKIYISSYVGYNALISKDLQPALHSSKAYDVVRDKLAKECWATRKARSDS